MARKTPTRSPTAETNAPKAAAAKTAPRKATATKTAPPKTGRTAAPKAAPGAAKAGGATARKRAPTPKAKVASTRVASAETTSAKAAAPKRTPAGTSRRPLRPTEDQGATGRAPSDAERRAWIAEAAYFRAARRGFAAGDPLADWLEAEREIDARLGTG